MPELPPSIFNDVIGPVMRGPSSSHTAASVRIGRLARHILGEKPVRVIVEFDPGGSLATTYESQGSAMGLSAGLMGWEITHPDLHRSWDTARTEGISIEFRIVSFDAPHPNTYRIRMEGEAGRKIHLIAISHGGGMVEITRVDDFSVSIRGDYYEVLLFVTSGALIPGMGPGAAQVPRLEQVLALTSGDGNLVQMKLSGPPDPVWFRTMQKTDGLVHVAVLEPVMPVLSGTDITVPFRTSVELLELAASKRLSLSGAALLYECRRSRLPEEKVMEMMKEIVTILRQSIREGLEGTSFDNRILGYQSGRYVQAADADRLIGGDLFHKVIASTMALMEVKSSMGIIVAAPTAGSCAALPGTLIPVAEASGLGNDDLARAFLAAGLTGVFIADASTFAAEECGCQAECGSASGMTAAGLVQLMGGTVAQGMAAASMALQNVIGLVCDPVANRVEVPCLGKNIQAGLNAIVSANMALAGMDPVLPLDEVITAMDRAGRSLPRELRCTGLGGLSVTPASVYLAEKLGKKKKR